MKERPILFSGPMVRSVLEGRKTHTRRVVKPQPRFPLRQTDNQARKELMIWNEYSESPLCDEWASSPWGYGYKCPYETGMRLWVRETVQSLGGQTVWHDREAGTLDTAQTYAVVRYLADGAERTITGQRPPIYNGLHNQKIPSIHMPRWASRLTLEITGVRTERLQDISEEDAIAEGAFKQGKVGDDPVSSLWTMTGEGWRYDSAREAFVALWHSINGKRQGASWDDNPWVWVVEFQRVQ